MAKLYFTITEENNRNIATICINDKQVQANKTFNKKIVKACQEHFENDEFFMLNVDYNVCLAGMTIVANLSDGSSEEKPIIKITQTILY